MGGLKLIIADQHVHSDNSPDGYNSVIELCESAVSKKMQYLSITDHCEVDTFYKDRYNIGHKQSYIEAKKAAMIFSDSLVVNIGIELGQAIVNESIADDVLSLPYDIVIGSMHALPGMEDFYFLKYENCDPKTLFSTYLNELTKLAEWGKFSTLAHLTYPLRYMNGEYNLGIRTEDFGEQLEKLFRVLIKRELSLEINTSGLRQKYKSLMPDEFSLRLYKSLGGERITFGSDAHRSEDIAKGIAEGMKIAKSIGFDNYCIYNRNKVVTKRI